MVILEVRVPLAGLCNSSSDIVRLRLLNRDCALRLIGDKPEGEMAIARNASRNAIRAEPTADNLRKGRYCPGRPRPHNTALTWGILCRAVALAVADATVLPFGCSGCKEVPLFSSEPYTEVMQRIVYLPSDLRGGFSHPPRGGHRVCDSRVPRPTKVFKLTVLT